MEKLLPCPFCGGEAKLMTKDVWGHLVEIGDEYAIESWNRMA